MLNAHARSTLIIGGWLATLVTTVVWSMAVSAHWSTTLLLFAAALAPMVVALALGFGSARTMTTHELLYSVHSENKIRS